MKSNWGAIIPKGTKYGDLTIIKEVEATYWRKYRKRRFLCLCDCGNEVIVLLNNLRSNHTHSCSCRIKKVNKLIHSTHGCEPKRLYSIWSSMINRCRNKNVKSYRNYGAKGIFVCKEWHSFSNFRNWALSNGYHNDLTIERINPFGNYEPNNCTWIPKSEQSKNRRDTIYVEFKGKNLKISEWAKLLNIKQDVIYNRLRMGWNAERALTQKVRKSGR